MDAAPILSHNRTVPARIVWRFEYEHAASFERAKRDLEPGDGLPFVLDVSELGNNVERASRDDCFRYRTYENRRSRDTDSCFRRCSRAELHSHHIKVTRRLCKESAIAATEVE